MAQTVQTGWPDDERKERGGTPIDSGAAGERERRKARKHPREQLGPRPGCRSNSRICRGHRSAVPSLFHRTTTHGAGGSAQPPTVLFSPSATRMQP